MRREFTWLPAVLTVLWLFGCSHAPAPPLTQEPPSQAQARDAASPGVPVATVAEKEFDFGELKANGSYVHEFKILNKGTGILVVTQVLPA